MEDDGLFARRNRAFSGFLERIATGRSLVWRKGLDAVLPLPEIGIELPLAEIYEAVEFYPEPGDDES